MPFYLIQGVLAASFACVWFFIGIMLLADKLIEIRRHRLDLQGPHIRLHKKRHRKQRQRTAGPSSDSINF